MKSIVYYTYMYLRKDGTPYYVGKELQNPLRIRRGLQYE